MNRQLVLVHGRSQQHKDARQLKAAWLDALGTGLAKSGLELPIPEHDVRFPYYGDTLSDLVGGATPEEAAKVIVRGDGADAEQRRFVLDVMEEARLAAGITEDDLLAVGDPEVVDKGPLNWGWVRVVLKALDSKVDGGAALALATNDVYQYLVDKTIKDEIDEGVAGAFTPGVETVVVGHSLGTVVAHTVLKERAEAEGWLVPAYVSVGSPLGISRIRREVVPPRWPAGLGAWLNAFDPRDVVALFPLDAAHFNVGDAGPITNKADVHNHTDNRHGISGYLDDAVVARTVYDALVADRPG